MIFRAEAAMTHWLECLVESMEVERGFPGRCNFLRVVSRDCYLHMFVNALLRHGTSSVRMMCLETPGTS